MSTNPTISPIKTFRESRGLRLQDLGNMFSPPYAKSTVYRWETQGVPLDNVLEIERVTGIPRAELAPEFFASADLREAV